MGEVQSFVENHLKDMVLKTFDPKKADTIFSEEGEVCLILKLFTVYFYCWYCLYIISYYFIDSSLVNRND